jgi:hypothetical protein
VTKLCERIFPERPFRNNVSATDAPHHLLFSSEFQQLEFRPVENHMLATLRRIGITKL